MTQTCRSGTKGDGPAPLVRRAVQDGRAVVIARVCANHGCVDEWGVHAVKDGPLSVTGA